MLFSSLRNHKSSLHTNLARQVFFKGSLLICNRLGSLRASKFILLAEGHSREISRGHTERTECKFATWVLLQFYTFWRSLGDCSLQLFDRSSEATLLSLDCGFLHLTHLIFSACKLDPKTSVFLCLRAHLGAINHVLLTPRSYVSKDLIASNIWIVFRL